MMRIQKFFSTVEEFLTPLIEYLTPSQNKTVNETLKENNGRIIGWLRLSYGDDNLEKFMDTCDNTSFEYVINYLANKNVKTLGRFNKVLDEIIQENRIAEAKTAPQTRRFSHFNPGDCFQCKSCNSIWSVDDRTVINSPLIKWCPHCGDEVIKLPIESIICNKVKYNYPKASILYYGEDTDLL